MIAEGDIAVVDRRSVTCPRGRVARSGARTRTAAAAAIVVLVASCTPRSGGFTARERQLGDAEARRIAQMVGLLDDAALVEYVRAIGERLVRGAAATDVIYRFAIVDMEEPNAFALPGGYVYVTRGLLPLANSEDELAGVIGHEIGHVAEHHAMRRAVRAAPLGILTGIGAAVTGIVSPTVGGLVAGLGSAANDFIVAPYSRGQEEEADRTGQELAARAGWDPSGLTQFLRTLEREEAAHGGRPNGLSFLATHPAIPQRVATTEQYARTLPRGPAAPIAATQAAFLRRLDGLSVGARAADGVFDGATFLHPDLGFHVRFPASWNTANTHAVVGASAPEGNAVLALERAGEGSDPETALQAFERQQSVDLSRTIERVRIAGLDAVRAEARGQTPDGDVVVELTWIAYQGQVYRFTAVAAVANASRYGSVMRTAVDTFGPITDTERSRVLEARLRVIAAQSGERVADVVVRTSTIWDAETTAIANGLDTATPLRAGQLLKVPVLEPYRAAQ